MAKIMRCDCGHEVRGETDDELVADVRCGRFGPRHGGDHQEMIREKSLGGHEMIRHKTAEVDGLPSLNSPTRSSRRPALPPLRATTQNA